MDSKTLALIATLVMAATMTMNTTTNSTWESYKSTHGKVYTTSEDAYRQAIFMMAEQEAMLHNADSTQTYTKGINFFSDLTNDEFRSIYLGYKARKSYVVDETPATAASINWVTKGAVQAVKDQGQCGSCWAFSAVASSESAKFLTVGTLGDFSESQLVDCSGSYGNQGCNGGLMDNAFNYYKANKICTEASYPYVAADGSCKASSCTDDSFRVTGYTDCSGVSTLTSAIQGRPVSVAVDAQNWSSYTGGIYSNCGTSLDHGVLLAGYTSSYWLIKNSWGASWGESGYIRLAPGNTCGLANQPSYPAGN